MWHSFSMGGDRYAARRASYWAILWTGIKEYIGCFSAVKFSVLLGALNYPFLSATQYLPATGLPTSCTRGTSSNN